VEDVTVSLPHLLGVDGILATFSMALDRKETVALKESSMVVREAINQLE
jgi:malate/lactate dehydrogenase